MPSPGPSRRSTSTTEARSIPQIHILSPPRTNSFSTVRSRRHLPRDNGFPEPFDEGSNTTLPHPEADLSPNAIISKEEVAVEGALKRRRLFSLNKHKKTISHGVISPQSEALHSVVSLSVGGTDSYSKQHSKLTSASTSSLRLFRDEVESLQSRKDDDDDDTPPTSPDMSEHRRSKGLLGRLRRKS